MTSADAVDPDNCRTLPNASRPARGLRAVSPDELLIGDLSGLHPDLR